MQSALVTLLLLGNAVALPSILDNRNGTMNTYVDSNQVSGRDIPNLHTDMPLEARDWSRGSDDNEKCHHYYEAKGSNPLGCDRDALLCYFHSPAFGTSVSAFCDGFITPTTTATVPATAYTTSSSIAILTTPPPAHAKRAAAVIAPPWTERYDRESMSSACSCLLSAPYVATVTATATLINVIPGPTLYCQIRGNTRALPGQGEQFHPARSWEKCKWQCRDRRACLAFAWDAKGGVCFTALQDVRTLLADNANTPWVWYDYDCPYEFNY